MIIVRGKILTEARHVAVRISSQRLTVTKGRHFSVIKLKVFYFSHQFSPFADITFSANETDSQTKKNLQPLQAIIFRVLDRCSVQRIVSFERLLCTDLVNS